jgi:hypothetical protein
MPADRLPASLTLSHLLRHNREELLYIAMEPLRLPVAVLNRLAMRRRDHIAAGYIGWLGHRNLGDEAMHAAIRAGLPDVPLFQFKAEGERLLRRLNLSGPEFFASVLLGGGTLINALFLDACQLVRSFGCTLHCVGTGVGSAGFGMPRETPLRGWRDVLKDSLVSVRGPLSRQRLEEAGVHHARIIGDPALSWAPDVAPDFSSRNRLVINLAQEPGAKLSGTERAVFGQIGAIAQDFLNVGGEVVGVALGNGDARVLRLLRSEYRLHRMTIEQHRTATEPLLRTLTGSLAMIGVRLHSAVLATCVGVPPILVAYRSKCEDFLASMDLRDSAVKLTDEAKAISHLQEQWRSIRSSPALPLQIYQRAKSWKAEQADFYQALRERIRRDAQ